ncbi:hypothetical protein BS78_08G168700 [Paspalum vaginatum]|nr:hypothetical protein BS78_08G168700 [Paspalum vaginatum]
MASGLGDAADRPRRFDLTMSRRTRRPPSLLATNCHQEDPAQLERFQQPMAQQQQEECEAADNSRRFSLQELIQDEFVDGVMDVATGSPLEESNAAATAAVHEGEAAACAEKRRPEKVAGSRRVIRMVSRYAKVRSIKPKPAPEDKNLAPVRTLRLPNN